MMELPKSFDDALVGAAVLIVLAGVIFLVSRLLGRRAASDSKRAELGMAFGGLAALLVMLAVVFIGVGLIRGDGPGKSDQCDQYLSRRVCEGKGILGVHLDPATTTSTTVAASRDG
jgi:hypothetical protein